MNTGAKEIQQVNPGGPDKQPKHQAPTISSIDKSLSRNHHRVWSPTHRRAFKEESKVANCDWVDYQACSLLQYINVIANLFIMGNYFNELCWKIIRANNLLQLIHQVTIEIRFRKSLAQERSKSYTSFLSVQAMHIFVHIKVSIFFIFTSYLIAGLTHTINNY